MKNSFILCIPCLLLSSVSLILLQLTISLAYLLETDIRLSSVGGSQCSSRRLAGKYTVKPLQLRR